jgi:hypothetical protein
MHESPREALDWRERAKDTVILGERTRLSESCGEKDSLLSPLKRLFLQINMLNMLDRMTEESLAQPPEFLRRIGGEKLQPSPV